jgi:acyl-coenzyme A synthetase/AMP-(fatty) acid ligase/acyl carrier protein
MDGLGQFLRGVRPDWLFLTSGLFHLLAEHDLGALASVGTLITGGDVLSPALMNRAAQAVQRQVMAAYGPTETTVFASLYPLQGEIASERVPIGSAVAGAVLRVLDDDLKELPVGEVGHLFVSGRGVARGYCGNPALTDERFVADPHASDPATRMYNTGDRARELPGKIFEFHGRLDRQVKIRGFRIELGEIEATAQTHPGVLQASAEVFEDGPVLKRIGLFVSVPSGAELHGVDLRLWLAERLPPFMMPGAVVILDAFPLDPNGKILRSALPYPWQRREDLGLAEPYVAPMNLLEQAIEAAWVETLELDQIGRNDNFFEIGGDSLRSVALVARLAQEGIAILGETLLDYQTIAELAAVVAEREPADSAY